MPNRIWTFRSRTEVLSGGVASSWRWRAVAPDGLETTSADAFGTLRACVEDARLHGFLGEVDADSGLLSAAGYDLSMTVEEVTAIPQSKPAHPPG